MNLFQLHSKSTHDHTMDRRLSDYDDIFVCFFLMKIERKSLCCVVTTSHQRFKTKYIFSQLNDNLQIEENMSFPII